ncbi:MAG: hypothetical protein QMC38_10790 [Sinobacterium sp.]
MAASTIPSSIVRNPQARYRVRLLIALLGEIEKVSISRGLALYPDDEHTYKALLNYADASMYEQKQYAQRESV